MSNKITISILLNLTLLPLNQGLVLAQSNTNSSPVGRIMTINGEVLLQRQGQSKPQRPSQYTDLNPGDLLEVKPGATATIFCYANRQQPRVPEGVSGVNNLCPPNSQPLVTPTGPIGPSRSPDSSIPDIISPRRTALRNINPMLRWYPVLGATRYTVRVLGTGGVDWTQDVSDTQIAYSGNPPLQMGGIYSITVQANNSESTAREVFSLLNSEDVNQVETDIEQISNQNLSEEAKILILVDDVYLKNNLIAEAIAQLETLVTQGSKTAAIYQTLGELYAQVGLIDLAKERYLQALELTKTGNDIEGQAAAQASLGIVYEAMGNLPEAIRWLNQAKTGYESLGDELQVNKLEEQLQKLETQLQE
ncbi:MAG TPA: hypothetical protein DD379_05545 [Cyanobacteria bacterium UBA11162]|nr:hypothetical protein [Cyanobacteria bacterium UBA11162]